jgi:hypothetical protein
MVLGAAMTAVIARPIDQLTGLAQSSSRSCPELLGQVPRAPRAPAQNPRVPATSPAVAKCNMLKNMFGKSRFNA